MKSVTFCPLICIALCIAVHLLEVAGSQSKSVPPEGCVPFNGCGAQTKRKDKWFKIENCRIENQHLIPPEDETHRRSAVFAINQWKNVDIDGKTQISLYKDVRHCLYRLDRQS